MKNKNSKIVTTALTNILSTSKTKPIKIDSHGGAEWYNFIFKHFLKSKNKRHYSRFTDEGPSVAERVIRTVRSLLKQPLFSKRKG